MLRLIVSSHWWRLTDYLDLNINERLLKCYQIINHTKLFSPSYIEKEDIIRYYMNALSSWGTFQVSKRIH